MPFGTRGRDADASRPTLRTDYRPAAFGPAGGDGDPHDELSRFVDHALSVGGDLLLESDAALAEYLGARASAPMHLAADLCDGPGRDGIVHGLAARGTAEARAVLYAMAVANDGEIEELAGAAARSMAAPPLDPPWLGEARAPIELLRVVGLVGRRDPAEQAVLYVFRRARRTHGFLAEVEEGAELPREITWSSDRGAADWLRELRKGRWTNQIPYRVSFDDVGRGADLLEGMMHNTVLAQLRELADWPLAADLVRSGELSSLPSLFVLLRKSLTSALGLDEWAYLPGTPWAPWRPIGSVRSRPAAHTAEGRVLTTVSTEQGIGPVRELAGSSAPLRRAVDDLYAAEALALAGGDGSAAADAALRVVRFETLDRPDLVPVLAWALASAGQTALVRSSSVAAAARFTEAEELVAAVENPVVDRTELRRGVSIAAQLLHFRLNGMLTQVGAAEVLSSLPDSEVEQAPRLMDRLRRLGSTFVESRQWEPAALCLDAAGLLGFVTRDVSPPHRLAYVQVIGAIADSKARQGDLLLGLRATSDGLGEAIEALTIEPGPRSIRILRAALGMEALMPLILSAPTRLPIVAECEDLRHRADFSGFESGPGLDEAARRLLHDARALKATFDQIIANNERR
ncbi:hypothetical protein ACFWEJ_09175 [Promicromonospora sp. NPDC060204]|uniref:hypothetical protein n=1 Tax=Promicromonospora sp. NPDC060204 TaxID=3347071 RepID=UPI003646C152